MDEASRTFGSDRDSARRWTGRIFMAVILGEAIWRLIVSVMDNVVVPWLGEVMGQSSGLPTSFTQRPYDYPDLFVSILEFCIAGIVAISLNWYFQRPGKPMRVQAIQTTTAPVTVQAMQTATAPVTVPAPAPPARVAAIPTPAPPVTPPPAPVRAPVAQVTAPVAPPAAAKPAPTTQPAPKPAKPQPPKEVYYNIVGDPVPDDKD